MKKLISLILIAVAVTFAAAAQENVTISRFEGKKIIGVQASGIYEITVRQGSSTKAELTVAKKYEDLVTMDLGVDGILRFGLKDKSGSLRDLRLVAQVTCSTLEQVSLSGACQMEIVGDVSTRSLQIGMSGASELKASTINVDGSATIKLSGASDFAANIDAEGTVDYEMSGAPNLKSKVETESKTSVRASGAPNINITVDTKTLQISTSGAPKMLFAGEADDLELKISGAPKVNTENLMAKRVSITASGAANLLVNASEELKISASGSTIVKYKGQPKMSISTSGNSKVQAY